MSYPFNRAQALDILKRKRKLLGRGLSYVEKVLFLHEQEGLSAKELVRGSDQIKLLPDRVLMQDATAQMAMLQFIQTGRKKTRVPATIHCDHLLRANKGAEADLRKALSSNREVYDFLSSAAKKYGIGFWAPGSGMMHQVIFENYAIPGGLMIGTDSHTPNAGGLGTIAIGVGGADAAEVMAGLHWEILNPYLVGVKLTGELKGWASAKDIIFEMLRRLSVKGGTGKILEYFGPGAETLSATQKATITNMGAELGATTSVFALDDSMDVYLRNVGRAGDADEISPFYDILNQDDICRENPEKVFDEIVEVDLGTIKPAHSGPYSPDRITRVEEIRSFIEAEKWPEEVSVVLLGSCTNSSYSDLYAAAQLLEQASKHGLKPKVPLMLSPGSTRIYETIKRDGILDKIEKAGATILTASCGPCIGQWDRKDVEKGVPNCLFTTFNRNFKGRNDANPETKAFLTSPSMAVALALSGDSGFNPESDSLIGDDNIEFKLIPPCAPALPDKGLASAKGTFVPPSDNGEEIEIKIDSKSDRIELLEPFAKWDGKDIVDSPILIKTKGKTTTDHISPGGKWLRYRGHLTNISNNMLEGAVNAFNGESGVGTNIITGEENVRLSELAVYYRENTEGFVIIGDENYGEGSSREHAAMSPRFMGARAVIAKSFARIHEANLKKQGILALIFSDHSDYDGFDQYDRISIHNLSELRPGKKVDVSIRKEDNTRIQFALGHSLTQEQIEWFKAGSALNTLRARAKINSQR